MVQPDQILSAVSLNQARAYAAGLIGPAVGGVLFALTPSAPFLADSLTYVLCALLTIRITKDLGGKNPDQGRMLAEIWLGLRYVAAQPFLRIQTLWSAFINFATAAAFFGLIPILQGAGVRSGVIGLWSSLIAGAGFIGALMAPRLHSHRPYAALLACGLSVALIAGAIALASGVPMVIAGLVLISAIAPALTVLLSSHMYDIVPGALLGRTQSSMTAAGSLIYPFAAIAMGALLQRSGTGAAYGMVAICLAGCAALCLVRPVRAQVTRQPNRDVVASHL